MLPLHGQDTAAIEIYHWAGGTFNIFLKEMFLLNSRKLNLPSSLIKIYFITYIYRMKIKKSSFISLYIHTIESYLLNF